jgi:hypothetical protein
VCGIAARVLDFPQDRGVLACRAQLSGKYQLPPHLPGIAVAG